MNTDDTKMVTFDQQSDPKNDLFHRQEKDPSQEA